jgi:hypothetical protein
VRKTTVFSLIKSTKIILEKIIKKNNLEKYCSKSQCFMRKATTLFPMWFSFIVIIILNQFNIKKKINKDNFGKNHGKTLQQFTVFFKKNYKAKFSISSILKK